MTPSADLELRVLVFAPIGRDGGLTADLLDRARRSDCDVCRSMTRAVRQRSREGAGGVLLTEEACSTTGRPASAARRSKPAALVGHLRPPVCRRATVAEASLRTLRMLEVLRNVTLLERPIRVDSRDQHVRAALRARQRQYELRDVLAALHERARGRGSRQPAEGRVPRDALARAADAAQRHPRLGAMLRARRSSSRERVAEALEVIERNARAQAQLIEDVLDISRIITGKLRLDVAAGVDCARRLTARSTPCSRRADAKGVRSALDDRPTSAAVVAATPSGCSRWSGTCCRTP